MLDYAESVAKILLGVGLIAAAVVYTAAFVYTATETAQSVTLFEGAFAGAILLVAGGAGLGYVVDGLQVDGPSVDGDDDDWEVEV